MGSQAYLPSDDFTGGSLHISMPFEWVPVLADGVKPYEFPDQVTQYMRQHYRGPGIYRWVIGNQGEIAGLYIGETDELPRRIYQYPKPGQSQQTN